MKVCYYALKPVRVAGEYRNEGELVPEATTWRHRDVAIGAGEIAPVLVATLPEEVQDALEAWEQEFNPKADAPKGPAFHKVPAFPEDTVADEESEDSPDETSEPDTDDEADDESDDDSDDDSASEDASEGVSEGEGESEGSEASDSGGNDESEDDSNDDSDDDSDSTDNEGEELTEADLVGMSKDDLYVYATELDISGRSTMNRDELEEAIRAVLASDE